MKTAPLDPVSIPLSGTHLIEASAGTGKTYTITSLVLRMLIEQGVEIDGILIVTYTRAAAGELRERVWERLCAARDAFAGLGDAAATSPVDDPLVHALAERVPPARCVELLTRAMRGFDGAVISTIHGFCQRMLQDNAFESGAPFETELMGDDRELVRSVVLDFWTRTTHAAPVALLQRFQQRKVSPETLEALVSAAVSGDDPVFEPRRARTQGGTEDLIEQALSTARGPWMETQRDWVACEAEVRDVLLQHRGSLRANIYKDLSGLVDEVAGLLAVDVGPLDSSALKTLDKLSTATLTKRTNKNKATPVHPVFDQIEMLVGVIRGLNQALDAAIQEIRWALIGEARVALPQHKTIQRVWSFSDLLTLLRDGLREGAEGALAKKIRGQFSVALIDEFQDTDPVQYEIFATIWARQPSCGLYLIGDPKQAIYRFRGADIHAYLAARKDTAEFGWTMTTNWRSDPAVLRAVQAVFENREDPFSLSEIGFVPVLARPGARDLLTDRDGAICSGLGVGLLLKEGRSLSRGQLPKVETRWCERAAGRVAELLSGDLRLNGEQLMPRDIAVLVRSNARAAEVQTELRVRGIPSVRRTDASVFASAAAGWLKWVLRAVVKPRDASRMRTALSTPLWGYRGAELYALEDNESLWSTEAERLIEWRRVWAERGFVVAFRRILTDLEVARRWLGWPDGERHMTDLLHVAEHLQTEASTVQGPPAALVRWLEQACAEPDKQSSETAQIRLESDDDAVEILTIHKSKGLEFPVVICPDLIGVPRDVEKALLRYHDPARGGEEVVDFRFSDDEDKDAALSLARQEAFAEHVRLLYVALTRARHRCEVFVGAASGFEKSALGHLLFPGVSRAASDADLMECLETLHSASGGALSVWTLSDAPGPAWRPPAPPVLRLATRALPQFAAPWTTSSFSRLARSGGGHGTRVASDEARDHDEKIRGAGADVSDSGQRVPLAEFPRGARVGNLLHDVLEHADFGWRAQDPGLQRLVEDTLDRYGEDATVWGEPLAQSLEGVFQTALGVSPDSPSMQQLDPAGRISELEFMLPVAQGASARGLVSSRIADALERWGGPAIPETYAAQLRGLRFGELHGWLRGFIDLVYCWQGRWYVVDFKSNHLGAHAEAYHPGMLAAVMADHHYVLQYQLYSVALHRMLQRRVPNYSPVEHFGGVRYLFLRGMNPEFPPGTGVYEDTPSPQLLSDLSDALEGRHS